MMFFPDEMDIDMTVSCLLKCILLHFTEFLLQQEFHFLIVDILVVAIEYFREHQKVRRLWYVRTDPNSVSSNLNMKTMHQKKWQGRT